MKILACKSIRFREENKSRASVEREYAILSLLDHPNIVKQVDVAWFPYKAKIYMEYCERGSLQDLIEEKTRLVLTNTTYGR
jgi:serine/threonine protein kinase